MPPKGTRRSGKLLREHQNQSSEMSEHQSHDPLALLPSPIDPRVTQSHMTLNGFSYDFDGQWYTSASPAELPQIPQPPQAFDESDMAPIEGDRPSWWVAIEQCYHALEPEDQTLSLTDICDWVAENYNLDPGEQGWKSGIRYNLSQNTAFESMGKTLWRIQDDAFDNGVLPTSQSRKASRSQRSSIANNSATLHQQTASSRQAVESLGGQAASRSRRAVSQHPSIISHNSTANRQHSQSPSLRSLSRFSEQTNLKTPRLSAASSPNLSTHSPMTPQSHHMTASFTSRHGTPAPFSSGSQYRRTLSPYPFRPYSPSPLSNQPYLTQPSFFQEDPLMAGFGNRSLPQAHSQIMDYPHDNSFSGPGEFNTHPARSFQNNHAQGRPAVPSYSSAFADSEFQSDYSRANTHDTDTMYDDEGEEYEDEEDEAEEDNYQQVRKASKRARSIRMDAYSALVWKCLEELGAPAQPVALQTIYTWFLQNTNKCDAVKGQMGMERSIRHNLSQNEAFERAGIAGQWTFAPGFYEKGVTCLQPTTHFRKPAASIPQQRFRSCRSGPPKRSFAEFKDDEEDTSYNPRLATKKTKRTKIMPARIAKRKQRQYPAPSSLAHHDDSFMKTNTLTESSYASSPYAYAPTPGNMYGPASESAFDFQFPRQSNAQMTGQQGGNYFFMEPMEESIEGNSNFIYGNIDHGLVDGI